MRQLPRNLLIAAGVLLLHGAALWSLRSGPLHRAAPVAIPVTLVAQQVTPPAPAPAAAEPTPRPKPQPKPPEKQQTRKVEPVRRAEPPPATPRPAEPAQAAPVQPTAPAPERVALAASPDPGGDSVGSAGGSAGSSRVELPSSDAGYLQNPAPVYPALSRRLGEQGKVLVRVLIGADGIAQKAEIKRSSGFDRLDRSALEYVMRCRYVPGKVGGVPQAMWYEAPVNYVLE